MKRISICLLAIVLSANFAIAQENNNEDQSFFGFKAGISLGTDVLMDRNHNPVTWNSLGFKPDLAFGPFGVGLDLSIRFKLMPDRDTAIEVFPGDWVPNYEDSGKSFLDLYLPKIMYVRYGQRGEPLFVKLGSIDDLTLGNGFVMGNYSNTRFLPEQRVFGLNLGIDGALFNFPYVGIEMLTGNLAKLDVFGTRMFVRPLVSTGLAILEDLQFGATLAVDRGIEGYSTEAFDPVFISAADLALPIIKSGSFPLAVFSEVAFEPNKRSGFMLGAAGQLARIFSYGAQLRLLGAGFLPNYFDANYDIFRKEKADLLSTEASGEGMAGWLAMFGTSLFEEKVLFRLSLDGPFKEKPVSSSNNYADYPHFRGVFALEEGILGGFFFNAFYDKYYLGRENLFFRDLINPENAIIGASFNYKTGAAVFTLLYSLKYNPDNPSGFDVTSSLQTTIKF
ncbi:hypothetical protein MASR2M29_12910 [Spirochaetota bacterium]